MKRLFILSATVLMLISCNDKTDVATTRSDSSGTASTANDACAMQEKNKAAALASVRALIDKNIDETLKNVDTNAVEYGDGSMPPVHGVDSVRMWMNMWTAAIPDYKGENLMAAADGNKVMVYGEWSGTWKNDFMGMKATGKSFKIKDVDIFTFNDAGKITEHRNVQSSEALASQIGMSMPGQGGNK